MRSSSRPSSGCTRSRRPSAAAAIPTRVRARRRAGADRGRGGRRSRPRSARACGRVPPPSGCRRARLAAGEQREDTRPGRDRVRWRLRRRARRARAPSPRCATGGRRRTAPTARRRAGPRFRPALRARSPPRRPRPLYASGISEMTLTYPAASTVTDGVALLAADRPVFFDGFATQPVPAARAMACVAQVAMSRFYMPAAMLAVRWIPWSRPSRSDCASSPSPSAPACMRASTSSRTGSTSAGARPGPRTWTSTRRPGPRSPRSHAATPCN